MNEHNDFEKQVEQEERAYSEPEQAEFRQAGGEASGAAADLIYSEIHVCIRSQYHIIYRYCYHFVSLPFIKKSHHTQIICFCGRCAFVASAQSWLCVLFSYGWRNLELQCPEFLFLRICVISELCSHLLDSFLFFAAELRRYFNDNLYIQVALSSRPHIRNALALESER